MKTKNITSLLLVLSIIVGCNQTQQEIPIEITVPSLQQNYKILLDEAKRWERDAYLSEVDINLFPETKVYAIYAEFYSPSQENESFGVYLTHDGKLGTDTFFYEHGVYHHEPISLDDWTLDSQDILDFITEADMRRTLVSGNATCSRARLWRILALENQPLAWIISVSNCKNYKEVIFLDPNTGAMLEDYREIKPTRIPTQSP